MKLRLGAAVLAATICAALWMSACKKEDTNNAGASPVLAAAGYKSAASVIFPSGASMYGKSYGAWSDAWVKWVYTQNCSLIESGTGKAEASGINSNVYFLTCPCFGGSQSVTVPQGKALLFPIAWGMNDYPCSDDPAFHPGPDESLQHFLTTGMKDIMDNYDSLTIILDGDRIGGLSSYRTSSYFFFFFYG
jgi:hypothetical protein